MQTDLGRFIMGGVGAEDVRLSETAAAPTGVGKLLKETLLDKASATSRRHLGDISAITRAYLGYVSRRCSSRRRAAPSSSRPLLPLPLLASLARAPLFF